MKGRERSCKPGPVTPQRGSTIISLGPTSQSASNDLPGGPWRGSSPALPIWSFTGWGLPCQPCHQDCGALLPHHFTLTDGETSPSAGGIFSVALSLASRPVAVNNHSDPKSPDFPPGGKPLRATVSASHVREDGITSADHTRRAPLWCVNLWP